MGTYTIVVELTGSSDKAVHKAGKTEFTYNASTEELLYPQKRLKWDLAEWQVTYSTVTGQYTKGDPILSESQDIRDFLDDEVIVTDPVTGLHGPFDTMQILQNRKALYNDTENPLYEDGYTPLVGVDGSVQYLLDMHEKTGWFFQRVIEARYAKPKSLLIFYGYPNSFNSAVNSWNNEKVAQDMAKYLTIALGAGLIQLFDSGTHTGSSNNSALTDNTKNWTTDEWVGKRIFNTIDGSSGAITANTSDTITATLAGGAQNDWDNGEAYEIRHPDYVNALAIITRIKQLNPETKIFGYVTVNQSLVDFQDRVDEWDTVGIHGIFMDESGYDYGSVGTNGRAAFNAKVDYIHNKTNSKLCFTNAWNVDHIIGTTNDTSYPNATWNSGEVESSLSSDDWYLLESFGVNTTAYSGDDGYESKTNWAYRGAKAIAHRYAYGINLAGVGIISNGNGNGADLFEFGFVSALMFALESWGTSDTYYGASSSAVDWWTRPDVSKMGLTYKASPAVQEDVGDSDVYHRYVEFGKLSVDFSSGAHDSTITKY